MDGFDPLRREMDARAVSITKLLDSWSRGEPEALDRLAVRAMAEVRSLAQRALNREVRRGTFQTTELISEVYLRLARRRSVQWSNRQQFFGYLAETMRHILVDRARRRLASRRGHGKEPGLFDEELVVIQARPADIIELDDALDSLKKANLRQFEVLRLSFFVGLTQTEIAEVLEISPRTVSRDLEYAKIFVRRAMHSD